MKTPNPGSDEAIAAGCRCPRMDNNRGRGYLGQEGIFVYSGDCPVHADTFRHIAEKFEASLGSCDSDV